MLLTSASRGDVSGFRPAVSKLAELTGCRCLSVRYRLAPQHPFPTALLDVLVTYLSLLNPPPGSFHEPVPASQILLVGDSAGANLCLALVQLILGFNRQNGSGSTVQFFGNHVALPLPAGLAAFSAWTDCTNSLPSMMPIKGMTISQQIRHSIALSHVRSGRPAHHVEPFTVTYRHSVTH